MTGQLTVDGYTFDNPPDEFDKQVKLSNTAVPHFSRFTSDFYQSDSQDVTFTVKGDLSLSEQSDLSELETLQQKAIEGGQVTVDFDPFFAGQGVITDSPFRQENNRARYNFTFQINTVQTDSTGFPAHATPTTGNTFELGSFNFGYDPESLRQSYERQTVTVETLAGINRTVDNAGLIPKVEVSGQIDGAGAQELWDKARDNELSYLSAEFQNGWSLVTQLRVSHDPNTPDFVTGLYRYTAEFLIVKDPSGGIGQVSSFIDHDVRDLGTYTADSDAGDADAGSTDFGVQAGTVDLQGNTTSFDAATVEVQLGQTNYVYVADPDADQNGEVRVNQSAFPQSDGRLYTVETDDNGITNVIDERAADTSGGGNTVGSIGFTVESGSDDDAGVSWSKTVLELDPSTTNYVYADGSTGAVSYNTSGFPAGDVDLYEVQTDATSVDVVIDQRAATTTGGDDELDTIGYSVQGGTGSINDAYVQWDDTTVDLRYSRENYVFVTDDNGDGQGQVEVNQSNVPQDALGLWKVTTDDSGITDEEDLRNSLIDDGDDTSSDLSFTDSPQIFDSDIDFNRVMALGTEAVPDPSEVDLLPALGLATLPTEQPNITADLSALGLADLQTVLTLDDGGSATGSGGGTSSQTVDYSTASDWDAAVSQQDTVHASIGDYAADTVQLGFPPEDQNGSALQAYYTFADDTGSSLPDHSGNGNDATTVNNVSNATADGLFNSTAWDFPSIGGDGYAAIPDSQSIDPTGDFTACVYLIPVDPGSYNAWHLSNFNSGYQGFAIGIGGSEEVFIWVRDSNDVNVSTGGVDSTTYDGDFHLLSLVWDESENTLYGYRDGTLLGSVTDSNCNGPVDTGNDVRINKDNPNADGRGAGGVYSSVQLFGRRLSQSELADLSDAAGTLTTGSKTFSQAVTPDLQNLSYSLNSQSITLDVIGSPGTVSKETQTVTLDGASSYSLTWSNSHSEFRLKLNMSTTTVTQSPTFAKGELVGTVSSGGGNDQNERTTWEIRPGQYDTTGNEYEGGGVVNRYDG